MCIRTVDTYTVDGLGSGTMKSTITMKEVIKTVENNDIFMRSIEELRICLSDLAKIMRDIAIVDKALANNLARIEERQDNIDNRLSNVELSLLNRGFDIS